MDRESEKVIIEQAHASAYLIATGYILRTILSGNQLGQQAGAAGRNRKFSRRFSQINTDQN
jgi:hypothetical protein